MVNACDEIVLARKKTTCKIDHFCILVAFLLVTILIFSCHIDINIRWCLLLLLPNKTLIKSKHYNFIIVTMN